MYALHALLKSNTVFTLTVCYFINCLNNLGNMSNIVHIYLGYALSVCTYVVKWDWLYCICSLDFIDYSNYFAWWLSWEVECTVNSLKN